MKLEKKMIVHGFNTFELAKFEVGGHKVVVVGNDNGATLLKDLILENKESYKKSEEELPKDKVIVLSDYSDEELKQFVLMLRSFPKENKPMLAVVTESSYEWPFEYLLKEHLIKDREEIRKAEAEGRKITR